MFCNKCGKESESNERFCGECGNQIIFDESESTTREKTGTMANEGREYKRANINEDADKKEFINKEKVDKVIGDIKKVTEVEVDKIKKATEEKRFKDILKNKALIGAVVSIIVVVIIGVGIFGRSTPEKAIEGFIENLSDMDVEEALEYTNFESYLEIMKMANELPMDLNVLSLTQGIDGIKDMFISGIEQEMYGSFDKIKIREMDIIEGSNSAKAEVRIEIIDIEGNSEGETMSIELIKEDGEWLIDIDSTNIF